MDLSKAWLKIQDMIDGLIASLPDIVLALVVLAIFYWIGKGFNSLVTRVTRQRRHARSVGLVLGRLAHGFIAFVGVLVALSIALPEFGAGQLIELLGIGSVAIGFAFRDIFQNFLAGILLLLTEPFGIGDQIVVDDFEGTVEDIQTRATMIKTYDGRRVVIPNAELFTQSVIVNTAYDRRRSEYDVRISYDDDIDQVKQLIIETVSQVEGVLREPPPEALVVDLAASTVNLRARWWTRSRRTEVLLAQDQVISAIKRALTAHGIAFPIPTQQIIVQHDDGRLR